MFFDKEDEDQDFLNPGGFDNLQRYFPNSISEGDFPEMMKRKASVVTRVKWTLSLQHFEECGQGSSRLFLLCPLLAFTILTKMESPYIQFLLGKSISSSLLPTYVCQVFILRHLQFMYALSIPSTQGSVNSTRIPRYGDLNHVTRSVWSSKLGALFGMDKAGHQGGNESLTYTAPKQPKKKESTPAGKGGAPAVIFAVAVNAYKYVDNKYASQGKLGAAILANHVSSEYSVLMYVSQQQKITTAKITSAFAYTNIPDIPFSNYTVPRNIAHEYKNLNVNRKCFVLDVGGKMEWS